MTTTNTFSGFGEDERKSSRHLVSPSMCSSSHHYGPHRGRHQIVLRPPGGGSSNIFGAEPAPEAPKPTKPYIKDAGLFGSGDPSPKTETRSAVTEEKKGNTHGNIFGETSPSKPAKAQVGYNPITGKPYESKDENVPPAEMQSSPSQNKGRGAYNPITGAPYATGGNSSAERTVSSSRGKQPPGGASTKLW